MPMRPLRVKSHSIEDVLPLIKFSRWLPLNADILSRNVQDQIGAYLLSRSKENVTDPQIHYVGRADTKLRRRLAGYVSRGTYKHFRFTYVESVKKGFELECRLYHHIEPIDNEYHPDHPDGRDYPCPDPYCEELTPS